MTGPNTTTADVEVARLLARAAAYKLLATAFGDPDATALGELSTAAWPAPIAGSPPLREAATALRAAAADPSALEEEHVGLFARDVRCSPYESAYGDGRRFGGKTVELADIAGFYEAFGLELSSTRPEMPDHIGVELTFMSVLCLKEAWALHEGLTEERAVTGATQRAFLTDHLGRWAEAFARELAARASSPFYAAAAALLALWIRADLEALGVTPTPLERPGEEGADEGTFTCPMVAPRPDEL
jgi:DMSO reductase family type II enzyme chaperone